MKTKREKSEFLVSRNQSVIDKTIDELDNTLVRAQKIAQAAKSFDFEFTMRDLQSCLRDPLEWATIEIEKQIPKVKVGKFEQQVKVNLPDMSSFVNAVNDFKEKNKIGINLLSINDGVVSIDEEAVENMIDSQSVYIKDAEEIALYHEYKKMTDAVTAFNRMLKVDFSNRPGISTRVPVGEFMEQVTETDVIPNYYFFTELLKRKPKKETAL